MSQPRINLYAFPHKGLRIALSQLSKLAGTTDYSNNESLEKLKSLNNEIVTILHLHAHSEEEVVLPAIEAKIPGSTKENVEEHEMLEGEIDAFNNELKNTTIHSAADAGIKFYDSVNEFHSKYLAHMAMEETDINPIIWDNFTDEEIMGWHGKVMSTLTPDQIMLWFKYIVPSLNPMERSIIMGEFQANAPEEFFNSVLTMLKDYMFEDDYFQLVDALKSSAMG